MTGDARGCWDELNRSLLSAEECLDALKSDDKDESGVDHFEVAMNKLVSELEFFFSNFDSYSVEFREEISPDADKLKIRIESLLLSAETLKKDTKVLMMKLHKGRKGINEYKKV